jgi:hypothetical protein
MVPRAPIAVAIDAGTRPSAAAQTALGALVVADACSIGKQTIDATCNETFIDVFPSSGEYFWSTNMEAPEGVIHVRQHASTRVPGAYVKACICPAGAGAGPGGACSQPLVAFDGYTDDSGELRTRMPFSPPRESHVYEASGPSAFVAGWSVQVSIDVAGMPTTIACQRGAAC